MSYMHLGRTGLKASRIALGAMNFGELTDEAASFRIMDEALDAGINFFDTADVYGGPQSPDMVKGYGTSEEIIGNWLASEQSLYNLAQRTIELEVIPALRHFGIGLIPWSPVGMGLLGGVPGKITEGRRATPGLQRQIRKFRPQREACEAPAVVALAWVIHNPVVTSAISGPRTVEQLRENLKALSLHLSSETLARPGRRSARGLRLVITERSRV